MWATSRAISRQRFDIVFFPSAYSYVPVSGPGLVVVVIHDIIAEEFPRHVFPTLQGEALWRLKLLAARWQADRVITVSEASRQGISRHFGIPVDRIAVVHEAADHTFRRIPPGARMTAVLERYGLTDRPFLLYVGGISPHKNLSALLDAFAELRREPACSDHRLVLVGDYSQDVFYSAYGTSGAERLGSSWKMRCPSRDTSTTRISCTSTTLPMRSYSLPCGRDSVSPS